MKLSLLFYETLNADYLHLESGADYAFSRRGSTLYIYFEASDGATDWKNNLDFPVVRRGKRPLFLHRGFFRVFESLRPAVFVAVSDKSIENVVISGYSHGAALAVLCYDEVLRLRPDLQKKVVGYGFGAPRVFFGIKTRRLTRRFADFTVVRNIDDLVTHLPPRILGYFHAGKLLTVGEKGKYNRIDAHRPENIMHELLAYEEKQRG